jgi:hypothetical protein
MSAEQVGGAGSGEVDATAQDPAPERAVNARLSQAEATLAAAARAASAAVWLRDRIDEIRRGD